MDAKTETRVQSFRVLLTPLTYIPVRHIDIEVCEKCQGPVKIAAPAHPCARGINASMHVIACVEDPVAIEKILKHLKQKAVSDTTAQRPPSRAPPQMALFEHS